MYFYSLLCHAIAMSSTVWNPLLYSFMNGAFRSAFSELMPCFGRIKRTLSGRVSKRSARYGDQLRQPAADADSNLGAGGGNGGGGGGGGGNGNDAADERGQPILIVSMTNSDGAQKAAVSNRRIGNSTPANTTETAALLLDADESKSIPSTTQVNGD